MEKEKQIEEMAKVLCSLIKDGIRKDCEKCYFKHDGYRHTCKFRECAIQIYEAGYRNVKEAVKEFAERIKMAFYYEFDELIPSIMSDKIDEIAKEYGVEVEE